MNDKAPKTGLEGRYLSFQLANEVFALQIQSVSEIIEMDKITELPDTEKYVKGIINLRGKIIPIIDLRIKLQMTPQVYNKYTCIIIVENAENKVGIIVDSVQDVLDFNLSQIDVTPEICNASLHGIVTGIGKIQEKNVILVDMVAVLANEKFNLSAVHQ